MKVIFHKRFYEVYAGDPAAESGRMEAIVGVIGSHVEFIDAVPATEDQIMTVHTPRRIESVKAQGIFDIASLSAGGAVMSAEMGLKEPCFGLIRPPGHHASADSAWGFCYFNNMAIAIEHLKKQRKIKNAYILDIDLHFGDGTVNILGHKDYVIVHNVSANSRDLYLKEVGNEMEQCRADIIGISAGFDNHEKDWGGTLLTEDYYEIGKMVGEASIRSNGGCFAILEGGYNHQVLGHNVLALIKGLNLE